MRQIPLPIGLDAEGRITAANDSLLTLLHKQNNDLVGKMAIEAIQTDATQSFANFETFRCLGITGSQIHA